MGQVSDPGLAGIRGSVTEALIANALLSLNDIYGRLVGNLFQDKSIVVETNFLNLQPSLYTNCSV